MARTLWRIVLHNAVERGQIEAARRHVRAKQHACLGLAEAKVRVGAVGLRHVAVQSVERHVDQRRALRLGRRVRLHLLDGRARAAR